MNEHLGLRSGAALVALGLVWLTAPGVPMAQTRAPADPRPGHCTEPVQTEIAHTAWLWEGAAAALREAGVSRKVRAMCVRGTGVWSAWVSTESGPGHPQLWAVVSYGGSWKVLCLTSEARGCGLYGGVPPELR